jgi:GT2 family glycosyltransferase
MDPSEQRPRAPGAPPARDDDPDADGPDRPAAPSAPDGPAPGAASGSAPTGADAPGPSDEGEPTVVLPVVPPQDGAEGEPGAGDDTRRGRARPERRAGERRAAARDNADRRDGAPASPRALRVAPSPPAELSPAEAGLADFSAWAIDRVATEVPAVVAVVVAHDPGHWFEEALGALADQDYPHLQVLVVDNGSAVDLTPRVADVLPDAFVLRLLDKGYAAAVNRAVEVVEGAQFLLLCHDDVAPDREAVRILVEEAYRSNAAIVGPKLVDWDEPDVLAEVGLSVDKFGIPFSGIEPGEVDQEQHDAVRDVFMVSGAAMLIRADLLGAVGGFDEALFHRVADMDLCWRARLLGARILVAPNAVVRHRSAFRERTGLTRSTRNVVYRGRLRTLLTVSSPLTLVAVLPQAAVMTLAAVLRYLVVGRIGVVRAWLGAWTWNLGRLGNTRARRKVVQKARVVPDQELRPLQVRTSTRVRSWVSARFDADRRARAVASVGRELVNSTSGSLREPVIVGLLALVLVVLAGSRDLIEDGVPAVGSFAPFLEPRSLWDAFTSPWRFSGLGSDSSAPPAFALLAALSTVLAGSAGLARTFLVVAAMPVAAIGAYRLAAPLSRRPWAGLAAALAYVALPVPRDAIAAGRLGPLVLYALTPALLRRVLVSGGPGPFAGWVAERGAPIRRPDLLGSVLALALLMAVTGAFAPVVFAVVPVLAVILLLAAILSGGMVDALRSLLVSILATGVAGLLLAPWSLGLLDPDPDGGALGIVFSPQLDAADVIRFDTGPATAGWLVLGVSAIGLLPFLAGAGWRAAWAARAWAIAVAGWALAWIPGRDWFEVAWPAPEVPLTVAAVGVALAAGVGVSVLTDELRSPHFSVRQALGVVAGGALLVGAVPAAIDASGGRWDLPSRDWDHQLAFTRSSVDEGRFRILWLGDPAVLPLDASLMPGHLGYGITRDGPGDVTALWPASAEDDGGPVEEVVQLALRGDTNRIGHLLGVLGVRYLAVPARAAPGAGATADAAVVDPLLAALARQTDLRRLVVPDMVLYENTAWVPVRALAVPEFFAEIDRDDIAAASEATSLLEAVRLELAASIPVLGDGQVDVTGDLLPGTVLFSERYDDGWTLSQDGVELAHTPAFGTINGYVASLSAPAELEKDGVRTRQLVVAAEMVGWLVAVLVLRRRLAVDRAAIRRSITGAGRRAERAERAERRRRRAHDDDELWGGFEAATRPRRWGRRFEPDDPFDLEDDLRPPAFVAGHGLGDSDADPFDDDGFDDRELGDDGLGDGGLDDVDDGDDGDTPGGRRRRRRARRREVRP